MTYCPDCHRPTAARPNAREGRCDQCRPRRRHSDGKAAPPARRYWTRPDETWSEKVGADWHMRRSFLGVDQ